MHTSYDIYLSQWEKGQTLSNTQCVCLGKGADSLQHPVCLGKGASSGPGLLGSAVSI